MEKNNKFVDRYICYPDITDQRISEGGLRLKQGLKKSSSETPLVSVVTIVYNAADVLEETIKSVLYQTYNNIEYIVVDGSSTDNSLSIIQKYASDIDYFVSEPDRGIYHAMNKGISLAHGDYICLLNAGDYYRESFIEKSVNFALQSNADIVFSAMKWNGIDRYPVGINSGILLYHLNINHMTFLVSKEVYENIAGPYDETFRLFSDDLWTRTAYQKNAKFVYMPNLLVKFSGGGLSNGDSDKKRQAIFNESGIILKKFFPFLTMDEAQKIILSRFKIAVIDDLLKIYNRYAPCEPLFRDAMANYFEFLLSHRENYIFNEEKSNRYLRQCQTLALKLGISLDIFRFDINGGEQIKHIFNQINNVEIGLRTKHTKNKKRILHFASHFSSPSETFIYDLIIRMDKDPEKHNIVLCDNRHLSKERPFANCIDINWDTMLPPVRELLYTHFFNIIQPDVVIGHFALNGWKINQRIALLNIQIPMLHMTHGIDISTISTKKGYGDYIINNASNNPVVAFSAVSEYLLNEAVKRGIRKEKISLVHNVVHDRFFKYRKDSDYYDGQRTLRVLNVGRLVDWKGHDDLLEGISYYIESVSDMIHLTILYGDSTNELDAIQNKINHLGIEKNVSLVGFINFEKEPEYYRHFDLFISSSKYTEGKGRRSETFGMSTLEAIAAGLPVIVTDAGGSPEVVGEEKIFAKIVPHADGIAIGKAIESLVRDKQCFNDNLRYAQERLAIFSAEQQLTKIDNILEKILSDKLKVGIFSSMNQGGAGKAAMRVHKALLRNDVSSKLITRDNNTVLPSEPGYTYLSPEIGLKWGTIQSNKLFKPGNTIFSINEPNLKRNTLKKLTENMDIINIQWTARFLSAEDIGYLSNLGKPLVITVRDMHPLTGGCHFFHGCDRWKDNCYGCPQLLGDDDHFPKKILAIKKRYWNMNNITFVALSKHTKNIIQQSAIYVNNRIEVIANPIELNTFTPTSKDVARKYFNIQVKTPLLFYVPSYGSLVKGAHEFKEALQHIKDKYPNFELTLIMAGSATALIESSEYLYPIVHLGSFSDDELLAKAYSSADVTIVPSLEETFSNTAAESVSCGTPVVGFKTGAIPEISANGRGASVEIGNTKALGEAIYEVLNSENMSINCRSYAEENFSSHKQGSKYTKLFTELKATNKQDIVSEKDNIPLIDESIASDIYRWQAKLLEVKKNPVNKKQNRNQLKQAQTKIKKLKNNKWYRFGKLSRKKKIWTSGKVLSKKMKIHGLLKPVAQVVKKGMKK